MPDFNDPIFSKQIELKAREIIEQAKNKVLNHPNFPILVDKYLYNFWLKRADRKEMFVICISEADLFDVNFDKVQDSLNTIITESLKNHSFLTLNSDFEIINSSELPYDDTQKGREHLVELSKSNNCVFFFGEKGVSKFIQGDEKGENIFLNVKDRLNNFEKFTLDEIKKAFDRYISIYLTRQNNYIKFFESKKVITSTYHNATIKKNLLKNKPEKYFRDDLIDFLNQNVQGTFNREMQLLSSKKPIDIHVESQKDGRLVFFEVKWLGISKHSDKESEGTCYINKGADDRINVGVKQTLEYIEELIEKMGRDLKCGYLIVFDARENRTTLNYNDIKSLPENLQRFYTDKFDKIDNIVIDNIHPSD